MIRLIVTDMDGTLLDNRKQLPADFDDLLRKLYERDIDFAVASGRSYATLKRQFADYLDEMLFICDNGAYVVYQQEIVSLSIIPAADLEKLIKTGKTFDAKMLLCGMNGTYHEYFGSEEQEAEIANYYVNQVMVEDLSKVEDEIFKIALFDETGAQEHAYPILQQHFEGAFTMQVSGKNWIDIMNAGVNKGNAVAKLQNKYGISREETMAFGDYLNDYELLQQAEYSFAMENAHPELKKIAHYQTDSNENQGVMRAIKQYVLEE